jgi:arylsulfatase A-like enzyme
MNFKSQSIILLSAFAGLVSAQSKPNIVLFLVDDLGWMDVGYRNKEFYTPNIDQLKKDGTEFTHAYICTPTSSPSRASLLTGKEAIRLEMPRHITEDGESEVNKYNYWTTDPARMPSINFLPLEEVTYAERLRELGYYNMFIGKWHLGGKNYFPDLQGFDAQYGVNLSGVAGNYYYPFFRNDTVLGNAPNGSYLTDVLTDKAVDFIRKYDKKKPFSLSVWHYAPHSPHIGRKDLLDRYRAKGWTAKYTEYGAMVTAMDESLGRIRKSLKERGIDKNTIILFLSDQGGYFSNYPLRGGKLGGQTLCEGGARVPFIVYYPGITKANTTSDVPVQNIDIFPSLVEIASGETFNGTRVQGKSFVPVLKGKTIAPRNLYFFRSYEDQYTAILQGNWKLIKYHSGISELYNIHKDAGEVNNLVFHNPEIAQKLSLQLKQWEIEAIPVTLKNAKDVK